jgi:hypothetical protein
MRGKPFMTTVIDTEFSPTVSELSVLEDRELTTDDTWVVTDGSRRRGAQPSQNIAVELDTMYYGSIHTKKEKWPHLVYLTTEGRALFRQSLANLEEERLRKTLPATTDQPDNRQKEEKQACRWPAAKLWWQGRLI